MSTNTNTQQEILSILDSLTSLEEAESLPKDDLETQMAVFLEGRGSQSQQRRKSCAEKIRQLKNRLHPLQTNEEASELLRQYENSSLNNEDRQVLQTQYVRLSQTLMESEQGLLYARVIGTFDRLLAPILAIDHGAGRSNRARRAKPAENVLSQNAGLSGSGNGTHTPAPGSVDRHGNRIGSEWDLGRDGAYDGLKVVVLQEYNQERFTGELPVRALRGKGFDVAHKIVTSRSELPTTSELDDELKDASQIWLISGSYEILSDDHLDVIVEHWLGGLGVYVFGDNVPYYVDANRLLAKMEPYLAGAGAVPAGPSQTSTRLQLNGDTFGNQTVGARTSESAAGFVPDHLLVTGLVQLYEGVTVASMDKASAVELGFEEVLREHTGQLVVVARKAMGGMGPVIVDGAFTKLYCHWGHGGSARFVRNCACWLSTLLDEDEGAANSPQGVAEELPIELSLEGAYAAECSISSETGPVALLASHLADGEINTTDFALDNNLALARQNMVLAPQLLSVDVAKVFLQQGVNPFTRCPVAAVLPLVKLSNKGNLKLVAELANQLFMGGRAMNRHSLNILLSVCEEMLHREPDCPEALRFFIKELLLNAVSTPDMLKGAPGGPTVPLEQGLRANITITGELVPLRKAFAHVARIVRLLANHASEPRLPSGTLCQVARRSLLKNLIGVAGKVAKVESNNGDSAVLGEELIKDLDKLLFDQQLGIPIAGSAKLVPLPSLRGMVEKILHHTNMDEILEDVERVLGSLNSEEGVLVSDSELTTVLLLLRARAPDLWKILIEPLLLELKQNHTEFAHIWDAEAPPGQTGDANGKALELANMQLTGSFTIEPEEHAKIPWPGFATPLGPSVFRCKCGFVFGDPHDNLDDPMVLAKLKEARNKHFQAMFGADANGYPTDTSAHFPLHRAVQRVLTQAPFKAALTRREDMEWKVADYLRTKKRGNIHVPTIRGDIQFAIDSYLDCRREGMPEPSEGCTAVDFLAKAKLEQKLILRARASGQGEWIDAQRVTQ